MSDKNIKCATCKHWKSDDIDYVKDSHVVGYAVCAYAEQIWDHTEYDDSYDKKIKSTAPMMLASDGSEYIAVLYTHQDHLCAQHVYVAMESK